MESRLPSAMALHSSDEKDRRIKALEDELADAKNDLIQLEMTNELLRLSEKMAGEAKAQTDTQLINMLKVSVEGTNEQEVFSVQPVVPVPAVHQFPHQVWITTDQEDKLHSRNAYRGCSNTAAHSKFTQWGRVSQPHCFDSQANL